ncbi:hypothetical protein HPB50_028947 [Hyalomma asiaticum]|nr:hypothetical protein HPB50_028947 [Hyalomma asiaticum]
MSESNAGQEPAIPSTAEDAFIAYECSHSSFHSTNNDLEHPRSSNLVGHSQLARASAHRPQYLCRLTLASENKCKISLFQPLSAYQTWLVPTSTNSTTCSDPTAFFRAAENKLRQPQLPSCSGTPQSVTMTRTALTAPLPQAYATQRRSTREEADLRLSGNKHADSTNARR